jgi:purine-binding chemotaxis protein CheW
MIHQHKDELQHLIGISRKPAKEKLKPIETEPEKKKQQGEILIFNYSDSYFGIFTEFVVEVIDNASMLKIPKAKKYVKGLLNFQNEIIPVFDLNELLFKQMSSDNKVFIIIIQMNNVKKGFLVDKIVSIIESGDLSLLKNTESLHLSHQIFIDQIYKENDKIISVLNIEKLLKSKEINNIEVV